MASLSIGFGLGSGGGMAAGAPFTSFNFLVEIDVPGVSDMVCAATFSDADGLEMNLEPKTIREGGNNVGPVHMAGQVSYGQLTLKRGMTSNFDLWSWFDAVTAPGGGGLRASATVVMLGSDGSQQVQFQLTGCLPIKLKAPALNAKDGIVAIEEMSIVYELMSWQPLT
jgi:phage tail-like protein